MSPDKRQPGAAPWHGTQEMITHQGVDRLARDAAGRLDVLISHDAPADATGPIGRMWMPPSVQTEAGTAQLLVRDAGDATDPAPGCSTGTGTNQTDAASTTAPKSSDWQPTDTPRARRCRASATSKPTTSTRYSGQ